MSDSNARGAFYAGLLLGGLVGAAAALLTTPQPGHQTRFQIQTKGNELRTQLGGVTAGLQDRGKVTVPDKLPAEGEVIGEAPPDTPAPEGDETPADAATA